MFKNISLAAVFILTLILMAYLSNYIIGSRPAQAESGMEEETEKEFGRYIENVAFGLGEKFNFDIGYGFINAGYASMTVTDLIEYNGHPCYRVVSTANSNKFFSSFYRVEDEVESIIDAEGIFSWRFEKNLREGGYNSNKSYEFDQPNQRVFYEKDTLEVAPYVQDALSILYYARTREMKVGESIFIDNFTDGKNYPLEVKVHRRETIKVKAGRFDCLVVEPLLLSSGIFKHEGKLTVWLTDDRLKMPVLMKSKVLVGSISAELTSYELGEIIDI
jgi:hypothetical protein